MRSSFLALTGRSLPFQRGEVHLADVWTEFGLVAQAGASAALWGLRALRLQGLGLVVHPGVRSSLRQDVARRGGLGGRALGYFPFVGVSPSPNSIPFISQPLVALGGAARSLEGGPAQGRSFLCLAGPWGLFAVSPPVLYLAGVLTATVVLMPGKSVREVVWWPWVEASLRTGVPAALASCFHGG